MGDSAARFGEIFGPAERAGHRYGDTAHTSRISAFLRRIPEVGRDRVRYLWYAGYYDGPLSGLLLFQGKRFWFHQLDVVQEGHRSCERYVIVELTGEQLASQERRHALFREKVGSTANYEDGTQRGTELRPRTMWLEYFDVAGDWEELDLTNNLVVAWYRELLDHPDGGAGI